MRAIEEIEAEYREAESRARALGRELHEARLDACSVHVGDIVRWTDSTLRAGRTVRETLVTKVEPYGPWLEGRRRNADGSWSKAVTHVYGSHEVIGHEESAA